MGITEQQRLEIEVGITEQQRLEIEVGITEQQRLLHLSKAQQQRFSSGVSS